MINKIVRVLIKILIILLICQMINIPEVKAGYMDDVISGGEKFIKQGKDAVTENAVTDEDKLKETSKTIFNVLLALGIVLSVIIGGILGIQMMWGSIEQQAKAKEMLIPYVAGCCVIFGAFTIWKICVTIFSQL